MKRLTLALEVDHESHSDSPNESISPASRKENHPQEHTVRHGFLASRRECPEVCRCAGQELWRKALYTACPGARKLRPTARIVAGRRRSSRSSTEGAAPQARRRVSGRVERVTRCRRWPMAGLGV